MAMLTNGQKKWLSGELVEGLSVCTTIHDFSQILEGSGNISVGEKWHIPPPN